MTGADGRPEPVWIDADVLHLLHERQLEGFGGLAGVRDLGAIESALARARNAWAYGQAADVEDLAATYLCALSRQQGYLDGNKRAALAAALVFLELNGRTLDAPPDDLYTVVAAAATGELLAPAVAEWMRRYVHVHGDADASRLVS